MVRSCQKQFMAASPGWWSFDFGSLLRDMRHLLCISFPTSPPGHFLLSCLDERIFAIPGSSPFHHKKSEDEIFPNVLKSNVITDASSVSPTAEIQGGYLYSLSKCTPFELKFVSTVMDFCSSIIARTKKKCALPPLGLFRQRSRYLA